MPIACPGFPDIEIDEREDKPSQQDLHVIAQLIVKMFVILGIVKKSCTKDIQKVLAH